MAFPTGWNKRCSLTIDADQVSGTANHSNFPVLLTEVNFPSTVFDNTQSLGQDLRFTSDEAGTTELAFEIVNWDTTNDKAEIWVKVPTVDYDDDTTFYVWYGNSGASAYAADATYGSQAVWSDYEGVWHLTNANDSSANGYNLTPVNSPTTSSGSIGTATTGAYDFEIDSKQYMTIADANCANLEISGSQSWFAWSYMESATTGVVASKSTSAASNTKRLWALQDAGNKKLMVWFNGLSTNHYTQSTPGASAHGSWYQMIGVYDSANSKLKFFLNGTKFENTSSGSATDTNGDFSLGRLGAKDSDYIDGKIDEVRIRDSAVTDGWAITEYNNQNAPATFVTEGLEVDVGSTSVTITPDALTATSVINDCTISTVRHITTELSVQTLTSSQPEFTVTLSKDITVVTTVQSLTASQPNCTVYPPTNTTVASSVIFIANRDRIAIKLSSDGKTYLELD